MGKLKVLSLFAGIGGFDLGLERTGGFETVAFCEIDPFCQKVLAKHWPEVPCYDDVRTLTAERLASDGITVDTICGGFPCTQVSSAAAAHGMQLGLQGEDSGLWYEYLRLIRELRPRYVIVENVTALLSGGLLDVLSGLASLGYDAEWHAIGGAHIGAAQIRDRVWIVAYLASERTEGLITSADIEKAGQRWEGCQADLHTLYDAPFEQRDSRPAALFRGVDDRPANWVDRVKSCGNAVMPDFPEMIGNAIMRVHHG